jgi:hypothetical protein
MPSSVATSLPDDVIAKLAYQAKYNNDVRRTRSDSAPDVTVEYQGGDLSEQDVERAEKLIAVLLFDQCPRAFQ